MATDVLLKKSEKRLEALRSHIVPVKPEDAITEAARQVLLAEFVQMLEREAGSRTGADIEDVHQMRVAIRRTRSLMKLLESRFKHKIIKAYDNDLRSIMRVLGPLRDLDVMIHDLEVYQSALSDEKAAVVQEIIEALEQRRVVARRRLIQTLNDKHYRRFIKRYSQFLTTPGAGTRTLDGNKVEPYQVRHVLPPMIFEHRAAVRAYDVVLDTADVDTLHALRIEFKELRYVISLFSNMLDDSIKDYIEELKKIQDHLGRLNDISIARDHFSDLMEDLEGEQIELLWEYLGTLEAEQPQLIEQMPGVWKRFNSKTVQRKLMNAVLSL